jgi:hypothetical protein
MGPRIAGIANPPLACFPVGFGSQRISDFRKVGESDAEGRGTSADSQSQDRSEPLKPHTR